MDTDEDEISTLDDEEEDLSYFELPPVLNNIEAKLDGIKICESDSKLEEYFWESIKDFKSDSNYENSDIKFKVVGAFTKKIARSKYVVYTIMVDRGERNRPALIERRYKDFYMLWSYLKENHPALVQNFCFPNRAFIGNFNKALIKKRSQSFEHFLHFIYSKDVLRYSEAFANFMYRREIQDVNQYFLHSDFENAIPVLENVYCLLCRLDSDRNLLLAVHLQLVVSFFSLERYESSYEYCQSAFHRFKARRTEGNHLAYKIFLPFLVLCNRLWWILGKDRVFIETLIDSMAEKNERLPDLLESLVDNINLPAVFS